MLAAARYLYSLNPFPRSLDEIEGRFVSRFDYELKLYNTLILHRFVRDTDDL
ncbi:Bgt-20778 [Blumeria graminis f. sp. tritici]|uniref:Bgt-20778 n=2 Tax=Blumeria graminis f. sp. tritici TaxID=62690 RepID=A0A381LIT8_BLUGR|nr:Bgt-20778 [Blumeria graminis f. sp. tritici]